MLGNLQALIRAVKAADAHAQACRDAVATDLVAFATYAATKKLGAAPPIDCYVEIEKDGVLNYERIHLLRFAVEWSRSEPVLLMQYKKWDGSWKSRIRTREVDPHAPAVHLLLEKPY